MDFTHRKVANIAHDTFVCLRIILVIGVVASLLAGCGMGAVAIYGAEMDAKAAARRREGETLALAMTNGDVGAAVHCVSYCGYLFSPKFSEKALQERVDGLTDRAAMMVTDAYAKSSDPQHWNHLVYAYRRQFDAARDVSSQRRYAEKILEVTSRPDLYSVESTRYAVSSAITAFEALLAMRATGVAGFPVDSGAIRKCELGPIALPLKHTPEKSWADRSAICGSAYYKAFRERMPDDYLSH